MAESAGKGVPTRSITSAISVLGSAWKLCIMRVAGCPFSLGGLRGSGLGKRGKLGLRVTVHLFFGLQLWCLLGLGYPASGGCMKSNYFADLLFKVYGSSGGGFVIELSLGPVGFAFSARNFGLTVALMFLLWFTKRTLTTAGAINAPLGGKTRRFGPGLSLSSLATFSGVMSLPAAVESWPYGGLLTYISSWSGVSVNTMCLGRSHSGHLCLDEQWTPSVLHLVGLVGISLSTLKMGAFLGSKGFECSVSTFKGLFYGPIFAPCTYVGAPKFDPLRGIVADVFVYGWDGVFAFSPFYLVVRSFTKAAALFAKVSFAAVRPTPVYTPLPVIVLPGAGTYTRAVALSSDANSLVLHRPVMRFYPAPRFSPVWTTLAVIPRP